MHLSPLFSSKKIVLSPLSPAGFFFAVTPETWPFLPRCPIFPVILPAEKKCCGVSSARHVGSLYLLHLLYRQPICLTAGRCAAMAHHSPFMTVAGAGKARVMVSTEQLSTLDPFIWVFGPRPRGPFFGSSHFTGESRLDLQKEIG